MQLSYALEHPESRTVLRLARRYGSYMRLLIMLAKGRLTKDMLKHPRLVRLFLTKGAKVDVKDSDGWTLLHEASFKRRTDVCKILLAHGAQVDAKDNRGWTPLHMASRNGHVDACKLLLVHGAQVDVKSINGKTPLHGASFCGHADVCALLRTHGAI